MSSNELAVRHHELQRLLSLVQARCPDLTLRESLMVARIIQGSGKEVHV